MIPTVTVSADNNPKYSTTPGNPTQDQVFLLSITEANQYFGSDSARQRKATDYVVAGGENGSCFWWLRSPGNNQNNVANVNNDGSVNYNGNNVNNDNDAVRPALLPFWPVDNRKYGIPCRE